MSGITSELKVGIFAVICAVVLAYLLFKTDDAPFKPGQAYSIYTTVPTAEGIQFGSIVQMAGVRVGRVGTIDLTPDGKAKVSLEVMSELKLPKDTKATIRSMGMLGDRTVHLVPGLSNSLLSPGDFVPFETAGGDLDELTKKVSSVSDDVKKITTDLVQVADALKKATEGGKLNDSIDKITSNIEKFTTELRTLGSTNQDDINKMATNLREVSESLKDLVNSSKGVVDTSGKQISDQLVSLQEATAKLDKVLETAERIAGKVERGEGTVGALLNERSTVDTLNDTIAAANELVEKVNRFQTDVTYRADFYPAGGALGSEAVSGSAKHTLGLRLASREDYYYLVELVSDPVFESTVRVLETQGEETNTYTTRVFTDAFQFSFQFARRFHDLVLRLGIKENHGGVGADYFFWKDRVALSLDVYNFPYKFEERSFPNLELRGRVNVYNHLYLSAGVDDTLNRAAAGGVNLYLGGGFSFRDDDLKYLLSLMP